MTDLSGRDRAEYVQKMFTRIAYRYDVMNRIMTAGQDISWRREVIRRTALPHSGYLLDLGTGTGDLAFDAIRRFPNSHVIAADFTLEMMKVGKNREAPGHLEWSAADALTLPFASNKFDAVVSGFLLRNVIDLPAVIREQHRVLKPGGRIVALDTTRPRDNLLSPLIRFHMREVIPRIGGWMTGDREAYTYLPQTSEGFLSTEALAALLVREGFRDVGFRRVMFGTIAIHYGEK